MSVSRDRVTGIPHGPATLRLKIYVPNDVFNAWRTYFLKLFFEEEKEGREIEN